MIRLFWGVRCPSSFKLKEWKKYLPKKSVPFHFDGSGEGMYGIYHKLKFLDKDGANVNKVLIILEKRGLSSEDKMNGKGMMDKSNVIGVAPPEISGEPFYKFYSTYLKKAFDLKFVAAYSDYILFNTYRPYMSRFFQKESGNKLINKINGDYQVPNGIADNKKDSLAYYQKRIDNGIFYQRPVEHDKKYAIIDKEIEYLQGIRDIFDKHQTDYRIVLAPTYDQVPMPQHQLNLLVEILGKEHIYNFTGKNKYTEPISNFFESDHYKPYVANEILEEIYGKENGEN